MRFWARAAGNKPGSRVKVQGFRPSSLVPRPSSLSPRPSLLVPFPRPSSVSPRPSSPRPLSLVLRPLSLVPRPSSLVPLSSSPQHRSIPRKSTPFPVKNYLISGSIKALITKIFTDLQVIYCPNTSLPSLERELPFFQLKGLVAVWCGKKSSRLLLIKDRPKSKGEKEE